MYNMFRPCKPKYGVLKKFGGWGGVSRVEGTHLLVRGGLLA